MESAISVSRDTPIVRRIKCVCSAEMEEAITLATRPVLVKKIRHISGITKLVSYAPIPGTLISSLLLANCARIIRPTTSTRNNVKIAQISIPISMEIIVMFALIKPFGMILRPNVNLASKEPNSVNRLKGANARRIVHIRSMTKNASLAMLQNTLITQLRLAAVAIRERLSTQLLRSVFVLKINLFREMHHV